jgi:hypothetical protein
LCAFFFCQEERYDDDFFDKRSDYWRDAVIFDNRQQDDYRNSVVALTIVGGRRVRVLLVPVVYLGCWMLPRNMPPQLQKERLDCLL